MCAEKWSIDNIFPFPCIHLIGSGIYSKTNDNFTLSTNFLSYIIIRYDYNPPPQLNLKNI